MIFHFEAYETVWLILLATIVLVATITILATVIQNLTRLTTGQAPRALPTTALLLFLVSCPACRRDIQPPMTVFAMLDRSGSERERFAAEKSLIARVDSSLGSDDRFALWRVDDRKAIVVYDNPPHRGREAALRFLHREFPRVSDGIGTHPEGYWAETAKAVAAESHSSVALAVWTGENTDVTGRAGRTIRAAAQTLADNPRFRCAFVVGVKPECVDSMLHDLKPLQDAGKLRWWPATDVPQKAIVDAIAKVRASAPANP